MKFFTPELYIRLNSQSDDEFDRASKEWASALDRYRKHLDLFSMVMPKRTQELAMKCQFHDAEVLSMERDATENMTGTASPNHPAEFFSFSLLSDTSITCIYYVLTRPVVLKNEYANSDVFSGEKVVWLYDEVAPEASALTTGLGGAENREASSSSRVDFVHFVLLSNGIELEIPFSEVLIKPIPLAAAIRRERQLL